MVWSGENQVRAETAPARFVECAAQHGQVLAGMIPADVEEVGAGDAQPMHDVRHPGRVLRAHPRIDTGMHHGHPSAGHVIEADQVLGRRFRHSDQAVRAPGRVAGRGLEIPAGRARVGARLAAMAHVVNGDDRLETKSEGQDVAGDERDVGPLAAKCLPQSPVRPQARERNAAPFDRRGQPRWRIARIRVHAHRAISSRGGQGFDDAPRVNLRPSRHPADGGTSVDPDDHRFTTTGPHRAARPAASLIR